MADVKWIKITINMFDNRKIKHLRRLPDGNNIVLIWVMLLTMAGRCNANGLIFLTKKIPYTSKMLADELGFEENTVQLALQALEQLGMIVTDNGFFAIADWEEHQNIDAMRKIREQNRIRKQRQREKVALPDFSSAMSHDSHATEEDIDKEGERTTITCKQVIDLFHSICVSYPSVKALSESRRKAIKARLKQYSIDDFKTLFEKAEASAFLKGANDRNWSANFDWLIKDSNMAKVIDGNYDNRAGSGVRQASGNSTAQQLDDFYKMVSDWAKEEED